jgi:Asp-tRNA(Asn)/Glu-tRNA(Gln) amidotransferase A subunit family amidase
MAGSVVRLRIVRLVLDELATGRLSAVEAVDRALAQIERDDLGAWLTLDPAHARRRAHEIDALRASGERGALLGAPVAVKDIIDAAGFPTTGGSDGWVRMPETDAAVVARVRAAGGIVLGKTATNEFAFGIDGTNPHHPPCRHPRDPARLPGGSSSGSTVAVATGQAAVGLGSDTSGSLRVPAALCGVLALRPTPGRVPRDGVLPLAPLYDVVGPIAATHTDLARTFAVLAGAPPIAPAPALPARGGTVEALFGPDVCHPDVAAVLRAAIARLGLEVEPVDVDIADAPTVHNDIQVPEGDRSLTELGVDRSRLSNVVRERAASARGIGPEARAHAIVRRGEIAGEIAFALAQHDVLLAPSSPVVAPLRDSPTVDLGGGRTKGVRQALLSCAIPFAQGPFPAISVPAGEVDGLPVGLQMVGPPGADEMLIALAGRLA